MTTRLITIEERKRHKRINNYIHNINVILIFILILNCLILLIGWIIW